MEIMKIAYHYSFKTLLFTGMSKVFPDQGYQYCVLPQLATWEALPEYNSDAQQCRYDKESDSWLIEAIPVPVTSYNKETLESKEFDDESEVTDDYTLDEPTSIYDEWIDGTGWVTNENNQTNAELQSQINSLEATQTSRMLRSAALGDNDSIAMLQSIEDQIAVIRAKLSE
jgi:hypothetical protein